MSDDISDLLGSLYPYAATTETHRTVPAEPLDRAAILAEVTEMARAEDAQGDEGTVSGSLYSGDHKHYAFLGEVFSEFSHANAIQRDMYPSATKFEGEVIAMTSNLLHGTGIGVITSGGSESLITALYSYREQAADKGVRTPNVVLPVTAHVALRKGAHWMGIETRLAPLTDSYTADVDAMAGLIDSDTIALVGSAGDYGHGLIDPIAEIAELAASHGIGMHVDGCLGGWLWPWIERAGYDVPPWDFRVPGVTSISADTHKYGYALKGSSVLLYRDAELRRKQYFAAADWPGGLYLSPGLAGSRSTGILASTWAAILATGESGYLTAATEIMTTARTIRAGVESIPELAVLGDPYFLVAFQSADPDLDIYLVNDSLIMQGWRMNSLQLPPALHFCVTRPNTGPGIAERFVAALRTAVDYANEHRGEMAGSGAMYGFAGNTAMAEMLMGSVLDAMHAVPSES